MPTFYLPDLGEGLTDAEICAWHVKEGSTIKEGEPLVSVETAKAIVEIPAPYSGSIAHLFVKAGETAIVGEPLVEIRTQTDNKATVVGELTSSDEILPSRQPPVQSSHPTTHQATFATRQLAKELGVDLNAITPKDKTGQISKADVLAMAQQPDELAGAKTIHGTRLSMQKLMKTSHESVVPVTLMQEADISHWQANQDITVTIIGALAATIGQNPVLNGWYKETTQELSQNTTLNLGLAVDTGEDLFVPVIKNACQQSPSQLRKYINQLKIKSKNRGFTPDDLSGASFTLSNFGSLGVRFATVIISPPQLAILGTGAIYQNLKLDAEGNLGAKPTLPLSLSFDHRVITGQQAAGFLSELITHIEAKTTSC